MAHAESPSLISLGLVTDVSQESASFRWGLATSCLLHALMIVLAVFLRFQSTIEEPFRTIDVALISLPEAQSPATSQETVSPPTPAVQKTQPSPPKVQPDPPKAQPPTTQPMEDTLPPLPTPTVSERLSDFLGSAIGSILVPDQQAITSPAEPTQNAEIIRPKDQSPLLENLQLPSTAPRLSRPERLHSTRPFTIPKDNPPPSMQTTASAMAPPQPKEPEPVSSAQTSEKESTVKQAPTLPELSPVIPFHKTEEEKKSSEIAPAPTMAESLRQNLPTIPAPLPTKKFQRKSTPGPVQPKKSSVPEISAPQLAKINPSQPLKPPPQHAKQTPQRVDQAPLRPEQTPPREKMSNMMKQLLGEVRVPSLKPSPSIPQSHQPMPSSFTSTKPVQSEMDHRIAKLSIPDVTPAESIKNRLQLLEVESTSSSGKSSSQASPSDYKYQEIVQGILQDQWKNKTPLVADAPMVVLKFRISRSGEISQIRVAESSGNSHYDSAAQRAVRAVNPLPPFPPEISDSYLDVRWLAIKVKTN